MATRNLTRRFVDARKAAKGAAGGVFGSRDNASLLEEGGGSSQQRAASSLPPVWVDRFEQVEEDVASIQSKMRQLSALHAKRLKVNFDGEEAAQEEEISRQTVSTTEVFRHAEGLLKQFSRLGGSDMSLSETTVRNNMQRSIAKKLQGLSAAFRASQREYMASLTEQKKGSKPVSNLDLLGLDGKPNDAGFTNEQLQVLEDTEDLVNQRDLEITNIAKSIEELSQIFKELAVLVIDQGTILDRIDYNMEQTVDQTKEGVVQLQKAEEYQKKNLGKKCICLLIILNIIMIAVFAAKHAKK
jgi:syntaxin 16